MKFVYFIIALLIVSLTSVSYAQNTNKAITTYNMVQSHTPIIDGYKSIKWGSSYYFVDSLIKSSASLYNHYKRPPDGLPEEMRLFISLKIRETIDVIEETVFENSQRKTLSYYFLDSAFFAFDCRNDNAKYDSVFNSLVDKYGRPKKIDLITRENKIGDHGLSKMFSQAKMAYTIRGIPPKVKTDIYEWEGTKGRIDIIHFIVDARKAAKIAVNKIAENSGSSDTDLNKRLFMENVLGPFYTQKNIVPKKTL